jgi:N6-L-threonylcarbamoyladenine synthase
MKKYGNCDFSYAGLKTSVRLCIEKVLGSAEGVGKRATNEQQSSSGAEPAVPPLLQQPPSPCSGTNEQQQQQLKADIAASFQRVAVEHLAMRLRRAASWAREEAPELQHLVVAGGVASNQYVRQQITQVRHLACLE